MIHLNLAACNMFKLLQERSANSLDAALLAGQLLSIENEVARMLEYVTVKFPEFPDHGIQHSLRILNYVSSILDDHIKENISDVEIFCFIMAALRNS